MEEVQDLIQNERNETRISENRLIASIFASMTSDFYENIKMYIYTALFHQNGSKQTSKLKHRITKNKDNKLVNAAR